MGLGELFLIAVGLSMDAFAIAICKGLSICSLRRRDSVVVGLYFGISQAVMPLIGYFLGAAFADLVIQIDHWIAFILLGIIGFNMIRESLSKEEENCDPSLRFRDMFPLAIATSIDALTIGISFAFLRVKIVPAVTFIGVTTFVFSAVGVYLGHVFGARFKSKAEFFGGAVLILLGLKILLEHLGILFL